MERGEHLQALVAAFTRTSLPSPSTPHGARLMRTKRHRGMKAIVLATATAGWVHCASAANQTWNSLTLDSSWSTASNWSAGPLANGDLLFFDSAVTTSLTNNLVGKTFNGITFN